MNYFSILRDDMRYQFDIDAELEYEGFSRLEDSEPQRETPKVNYPTGKGRRRSVAKAHRRSSGSPGLNSKSGVIHRRGNRNR